MNERNKFSGFRYAKFRRCAISKANDDYYKENEKETPCYRYLDEHHQTFQYIETIS